MAVPPTVILPHKQHPPDTTDRSMRNLQFPLDWERCLPTSAFPGSSSRWMAAAGARLSRADSEEFFRPYDQTRDLCMMLKKAVDFEEYFRCYVVGQEKVHIMRYDPAPLHERYVKDPPAYDQKLLKRVERDALTLCRALGYDLNTVEFAVEKGIPYAIDFMNPAPERT